MIGFLSGKIEKLTKEYVLVMTAGGVGYRVFMSASDLGGLTKGEAGRMFIHTTVREDAILLYGFLEEQSYDLFELLLGVKGIGPRIALSILSSTQPENFIGAVQNKDVHFLTQLPGIGKKGAERLILELKDKVGSLPESNFGAVPGKESVVYVAQDNTPMAEAMEALLSLGYSRSEVLPVLKQIPEDEHLTGEEVLRRALKIFARS